ncbi:MAG: tRNA uridine-5-carboxymethylaminomethyl(34) synthesis enzyme MnmG [Bacteroidales bacterium]|nr:tRNA uridine-5-carboxymethylaminomethyl(34) synthesis enzyme MnmG [Bacteroidales bacterium]
MSLPLDYDVIVVGGGHAGCEAACAAANMGASTLLITMDITKVAQMSCNPAMGGIAKGQIIREIDAMGGYSALVTDKSLIQFRMLNRSKGPAMWSPRAQCDRTIFTLEWRKVLESTKNLDLLQDTVNDIIIEEGRITGVKTEIGIALKAKVVILTNGTFLNGLMHIGKSQIAGGRMGDKSSFGISEKLSSYGFKVGRMKTGTPARIDGRSIDFSKMIEQKGDEMKRGFSYIYEKDIDCQGRSCYITYTSKDVHDKLEEGFKDSPLFDGTIDGIGPRYCPSIETKLVTFNERDRHQLFIEPEGYETVEFYINGFSSSLPWEIQYEALRKIPGLENAKIFRPGYAIEYDYYPPNQLYHTLETKLIKNLFFAGQINGTTGYEEAAAQGLMAGINAYLKINKRDGFILQRDQAYIGVLIDDLVTKGVDEPYRMFTSRAEYRILLRQDNADERLTEISYNLGLAKKCRLDKLNEKKNYRNEILKFARNTNVTPEQINSYLESRNSAAIKEPTRIERLIIRPEMDLKDFLKFINPKILSDLINLDHSDEIIESAEIETKYSGYIERERIVAEKIKRLENIRLADDFNFLSINSISTEARQKLNAIKPKTIGQASRIPGVSPSDINILLIKLGR